MPGTGRGRPPESLGGTPCRQPDHRDMRGPVRRGRGGQGQVVVHFVDGTREVIDIGFGANELEHVSTAMEEIIRQAQSDREDAFESLSSSTTDPICTGWRPRSWVRTMLGTWLRKPLWLPGGICRRCARRTASNSGRVESSSTGPANALRSRARRATVQPTTGQGEFGTIHSMAPEEAFDNAETCENPDGVTTVGTPSGATYRISFPEGWYTNVPRELVHERRKRPAVRLHAVRLRADVGPDLHRSQSLCGHGPRVDPTRDRQVSRR